MATEETAKLTTNLLSRPIASNHPTQGDRLKPYRESLPDNLWSRDELLYSRTIQRRKAGSQPRNGLAVSRHPRAEGTTEVASLTVRNSLLP
jgi:hypothetical protein